jgi:hypothetical protein
VARPGSALRSLLFHVEVLVTRSWCSLLLLITLTCAHEAHAQNWSFDARSIALGATGGSENLASAMIADERAYRSIVLPLGLLQVLRDFGRLNPTHDEFDFVRTIEYAAAPLHYQLGRDYDEGTSRFAVDVRQGRLSRNLNTYRGFVPANQPAAEGLASPTWGGTIRVHEGDRGAFQGIYIGAGPYLAMRTDVSIDPRLIDILGSATDVYLPNAALQLGSSMQAQLALAVTGGYRGRFAWPSSIASGSPREGLYVAANYKHLRGFRYENVDSRLRLDTDSGGLLSVDPRAPSPIAVVRESATSGSGYAVDMGVGAVIRRWQFGFGANGIGNRIDWTDAERRSYVMDSVVSGDGEFDEGAAELRGNLRLVLPVDYSANAAYAAEGWTAQAEYARGFQGTSLRAGYEYRLGRIDLRGGAVYSRELWNPTAGVGLNLGERLSFDVAAYGTTANAERERRMALAFSLRINH